MMGKPMQLDKDKEWWASVRTVMQGLILTGIIAVVSMLWKQNDSTAAQNYALGQLQVQVSNLQTSLIGLPDLNNRVMRLETNQSELLRRQANDESWRDRMQGDGPGTKLKGWTK